MPSRHITDSTVTTLWGTTQDSREFRDHFARKVAESMCTPSHLNGTLVQVVSEASINLVPRRWQHGLVSAKKKVALGSKMVGCGGDRESHKCRAPDPPSLSSRAPNGEDGELGREPEMEEAELSDSCPLLGSSSWMSWNSQVKRSSSTSGERSSWSVQLPSLSPSTWITVKVSAHGCNFSLSKRAQNWEMACE
eukprot:superscaffoldBa00005480_g20396